MINPLTFINGLQEAGITFVTGVPDSLLKDICACITSKYGKDQHIIATNEGSAVGLAIGHYLATSRPALVYMQNSGLGNIINPLTSLADPQVYGIPMVLMIGWRGELLEDLSQIKDEPQHVKQGQVTLAMLQTLGIPYEIVDAATDSIEKVLLNLATVAISRSGPVALVVRKNTFAKFDFNPSDDSCAEMSREDAIREILAVLPKNSVVVATTGMASRELFELRKKMGFGHQCDFLTVGGMGHASQIAAGIALSCTSRTVVCIDGDGALLMHAGALAVSSDCPNLVHIVLNNEAHDSVGGQPTKGNVICFDKVAASFGYQHVGYAVSRKELLEKLTGFFGKNSSAFLEVKCRRGARKDLGRPNRSPVQNKADFMNFLGGSE